MFVSRNSDGMTRRHFLNHMTAASMLTAPAAMAFTSALRAGAADMKKRHKAAILLFMEGGPATIDIWDLKPGQSTGGEFKPISTTGDMQISEHLPLMAKQMHHMNIIRSMSTREADHQRGRYYMHTGYPPNPSIEYPSYGAVISHELISSVPELQIPPFVSIGGSSIGPGFLGMSYAPFVVDSNGDVRNMDMSMDQSRLWQRMKMLDGLEKSFAGQDRGDAATDHMKVLKGTYNLMTSKQMAAFKVGSPGTELEFAL